MTKDKEDYVSFKVAKLLKEKGFDERTIYHYITGDTLQHNIAYNQYKNSEMENAYSAPTHQMARRWLRETHRIDIIIEISHPSDNDRKYYCMIWDGNNNSYILDLFNSYEEAVEAALEYCLENLI